MSELSPQSRKVFEAFNSQFDWIEDGVPGPQFKAVAAALRAAADQLAVADEDRALDAPWEQGFTAGMSGAHDGLLAIVDELEAQ